MPILTRFFRLFYLNLRAKKCGKWAKLAQNPTKILKFYLTKTRTYIRMGLEKLEM